LRVVMFDKTSLALVFLFLVEGFPLNGEQYRRQSHAKDTSLCGNTSYDVLSVKIGPPIRAGRDPKTKVKRSSKKPKRVTSHVLLRRLTHLHASSYRRHSYVPIIQVSQKSV